MLNYNIDNQYPCWYCLKSPVKEFCMLVSYKIVSFIYHRILRLAAPVQTFGLDNTTQFTITIQKHRSIWFPDSNKTATGGKAGKGPSKRGAKRHPEQRRDFTGRFSAYSSGLVPSALGALGHCSAGPCPGYYYDSLPPLPYFLYIYKKTDGTEWPRWAQRSRPTDLWELRVVRLPWLGRTARRHDHNLRMRGSFVYISLV